MLYDIETAEGTYEECEILTDDIGTYLKERFIRIICGGEEIYLNTDLIDAVIKSRPKLKTLKNLN